MKPINTKPELKEVEKKTTEETQTEVCAEDALVCPCFPKINIEDHISQENNSKYQNNHHNK